MRAAEDVLNECNRGGVASDRGGLPNAAVQAPVAGNAVFGDDRDGNAHRDVPVAGFKADRENSHSNDGVGTIVQNTVGVDVQMRVAILRVRVRRQRAHQKCGNEHHKQGKHKPLGQFACFLHCFFLRF